jgi:hypothetical protein
LSDAFKYRFRLLEILIISAEIGLLAALHCSLISTFVSGASGTELSSRHIKLARSKAKGLHARRSS